jgi:hypothetical protein
MGRRINWFMVPVVVAGLLTALMLSGCDNVILRDEVKAILTGPEIIVRQAGAILDSGDTFDYGSYEGALSKTFTIENSGLQTLRLTGTPFVSISGHTDSFTIDSQPPVDAIDPGTTADFVVKFDSSPFSGTGQRTANLLIPNNDDDEGSFAFSVTAYDAC